MNGVWVGGEQMTYLFDLAMLGLLVTCNITLPSEYLFALIAGKDEAFIMDGFNVSIQVTGERTVGINEAAQKIRGSLLYVNESV